MPNPCQSILKRFESSAWDISYPVFKSLSDAVSKKKEYREYVGDSGVTPQEAISQYQGESRFFNGFLRSGTDIRDVPQYVRDAVDAMDTACELGKLTEPLVVYRAMQYPPQVTEPRFAVGDEYVDWGYMSTTLNPRVALTYSGKQFKPTGDGHIEFVNFRVDPYLFVMHLKEGTECVPADENWVYSGREQEIIVKRETKFRVVSVDMKKRVIEMESIV